MLGKAPYNMHKGGGHAHYRIMKGTAAHSIPNDKRGEGDEQQPETPMGK
jgi:hypothetical protein